MSFDPNTILAAIQKTPEARKGLAKLFGEVGDQFGFLMKPIHTRRQAQADGDASVIKAKAKNEIAIEQQRAKGQIAIVDLENEDAIRQFKDRLNQRISRQEERRQENLETITAIAAESLTDQSKPVSDDPVDPDWVASFISHCQDVSNDQMQGLWARILAGEVTMPGSFSLRTLAFVRTMSKYDADLFTRLCSIVWEVDDHVLHPLALNIPDVVTIPGVGLGFREFASLDAIGLIRFESSASHHVTYTYEDPDPDAEPSEHMKTTWYYHGRRYFFLAPIADSIIARRKNPTTTQAMVHLATGPVLLTEMGRELYPIAGGSPNENYLRYLVGALAKREWVVQEGDVA